MALLFKRRACGGHHKRKWEVVVVGVTMFVRVMFIFLILAIQQGIAIARMDDIINHLIHSAR